MNKLQELLDKEALLENQRIVILKQITKLRGDVPPACWGTDDCGTNMLVCCPWRIDCGDKDAVL
jgi:hypothetical protein